MKWALWGNKTSSSLASACAGEGGEQCRLKQHCFISFFFFLFEVGKKMNLGNNPKMGYNRHNQTFLLKKSIFINFLWSVLSSPHPPDNTISSPYIQYSTLSSPISFLSECAF